MRTRRPSQHCLHCRTAPAETASDRSSLQFEFALCNNCAKKIQSGYISTREAIKLYLSLRAEGVNAELDKSDGYKTIDIVVESARIHIEVDAQHHHHDDEQGLTDLQRMIHSLNDGYHTLRIPNPLVNKKLKKTTEFIVKYLKLTETKVRKAS
ncbi:MAG TPA: DUF559 domain-containing protein [Chitinophagaceae bacterium]|jgi:very-short-patch-repair endonuclease|nr:DUF559 domain-containing protein [Chitinophagaceae bacterium]